MIHLKCLTLVGLFFLSSCTPKINTNISTKPVVKVNDITLNLNDFSYALAKKLKNFDALAAKDPIHINRAKEEVIKEFIINCLVVSWAHENKTGASDEEIEKELTQFRNQYKNDDVALRMALAQEKTSINEWKEQVRHSILEKKLFAFLNTQIQKPSEEEIRKYFDSNIDRYKMKEAVLIRQIVTNEEGKAEIIKEELKKKSFEEVARSYSIMPEAKAGGLIGWMEKGTLDFIDQIFNQKIGVISPIIKSDYGFHIIKIIDRQPAKTRSYTDVRSSLEKEIMAQREKAAYLAWIDSKLRQNKIYRDNNLINAVNIETRGQ